MGRKRDENKALILISKLFDEELLIALKFYTNTEAMQSQQPVRLCRLDNNCPPLLCVRTYVHVCLCDLAIMPQCDALPG